jgi:hypothetical protein
MELTMWMCKFCFVFVQVIRTLPDRYSTGETPWVKSIIDKYHETAKANGAIVRCAANFNHMYSY